MSNIYKKASKDLKKMQNLLLKSHDYLRSAVKRRKKERTKRTKIDVYEKVCPKQMLLHKCGQINAIDHRGGAGDAKMSHPQNSSVKIFREHCRYFTIKKLIKEKIKEEE